LREACGDRQILLSKTKYSDIVENVHAASVSLNTDLSLGIPLLRDCSRNPVDIKGELIFI
jgi:hypothetical protein